jgi:hypothetical protein
LGGEEHAKSQRVEKVARCQKTAHRTKGETSAALYHQLQRQTVTKKYEANLQKFRDMGHLRNRIAREAAFFTHDREDVLVLVAGMSGHQTHHFVVDNTPCLYL